MPLGSEEMIDENELNLIDSEEASGLSWARVEVRVTTQVIEHCSKWLKFCKEVRYRRPRRILVEETSKLNAYTK